MEKRLMYVVGGETYGDEFYDYFNLDAAKKVYDKEVEYIKSARQSFFIRIDLVEVAIDENGDADYEKYERVIGTVCKFEM